MKVVDTEREDDAEIQHIFEEIDTLRALSHRNIIQFISCGKDENTVYVFMELMEGVSVLGDSWKLKISGNDPHVFEKVRGDGRSSSENVHQAGLVWPRISPLSSNRS